MFTSKLPRFATSAQRPSSSNNASTSFASSAIPVSVRKANLFTPQPQRAMRGTFSTGKPSYMTSEKKYQRLSKPVPDRDEQMKMFTTLVDFLRSEAPGFPIPDPRKFMSSVSTTEASSIFELLLGRLLLNFKINKLEEDVPKALGALDYPFIRSVTKSALVSITTRQAVGNLLVIFNWLINLIEIQSNPSPKLSTDNPSVTSLLKGDDALDQEGYPGSRDEEVVALQREHEDISRDIHRMNIKAEEFEQLEARDHEMEGDIRKFAEYKSKMEQYFKTRQDKLDTFKQEHLNMCKEISATSKAVEVLKVDPSVLRAVGQPDLETIQRLESDIDHLKSRLARENAEYETAIIELDRQLREVLQSDTVKLEIHQAEGANLKQLLESEKEKLEAAEKEDSENQSAQFEWFKASSELIKQEARECINRVNRDCDYWKQNEKRIADNAKVVRDGLKPITHVLN